MSRRDLGRDAYGEQAVIVLMARHRSNQLVHRDYLIFDSSLQHGKEESAKSGDLLVETEPIRYELSAVKLNWPKRRDVKPRIPRILSNVTITNHGEEPSSLAEACTYTYKYAVYWGRRHAILSGLSTTITLANGTSLPNITWGMRDEENRTEAYK